MNYVQRDNLRKGWLGILKEMQHWEHHLRCLTAKDPGPEIAQDLAVMQAAINRIRESEGGFRQQRARRIEELLAR